MINKVIFLSLLASTVATGGAAAPPAGWRQQSIFDVQTRGSDKDPWTFYMQLRDKDRADQIADSLRQAGWQAQVVPEGTVSIPPPSKEVSPTAYENGNPNYIQMEHPYVGPYPYGAVNNGYVGGAYGYGSPYSYHYPSW